jgi:hypothetical protein
LTHSDHKPRLQVHPDTRIVSNRGQLFAVHLSGQAQPCALSEADLCLLEAVRESASPDSAAQRLVSGDLCRLLPAPPPPDNVAARLRQLTQARLLELSDSGTPDRQPSPGPASIRLADTFATHVKLTAPSLRLGKNF